MSDRSALAILPAFLDEYEPSTSMPLSRLSTSALREDCGLSLMLDLPFDAPMPTTTRHTLTCLEPPEELPDDDQIMTPPSSIPRLQLQCSTRPHTDTFGVPSWSSVHENSSSVLPSAPYEGITMEIKNHSINSQGVVLYHVDVGGRDGILSMYTIRRRFRAFRNLYFEMDRLMTEYAAQLALMAHDDDCFSEAATEVPCSPSTLSFQRQRHAPAAIALPPLPSAGIWSYLKRHDIHLVEHRKTSLQAFLRIVMQHPATRCSALLDTFLSVAPNQISQRGTSYVSLQDYSVPVIDRKRESIERKQRKIRVLEQRQRTSSSSAPISASGRHVSPSPARRGRETRGTKW